MQGLQAEFHTFVMVSTIENCVIIVPDASNSPELWTTQAVDMHIEVSSSASKLDSMCPTKDNSHRKSSGSEVQTKSGLHVCPINDNLTIFEITTVVESERRSE